MKRINIPSLGISTILTIILITFMTLYAEFNAVFKDFLKNLTGHHWTSKGVIALVFFVVSYLILKQFSSTNNDSKKMIDLVIISALLGSLVIFLFFSYEFFG